MVVCDNIAMFDMAVECGAAINIENKQKLTPLTMAAYLARMDMFFHIASIEREIYWQVKLILPLKHPPRHFVYHIYSRSYFVYKTPEFPFMMTSFSQINSGDCFSFQSSETS